MWRDMDDRPEEYQSVEIKTVRGAPIDAVYFEGSYYVDGSNQTVMAYAVPTGWRPRGER